MDPDERVCRKTPESADYKLPHLDLHSLEIELFLEIKLFFVFGTLNAKVCSIQNSYHCLQK